MPPDRPLGIGRSGCKDRHLAWQSRHVSKLTPHRCSAFTIASACMERPMMGPPAINVGFGSQSTPQLSSTWRISVPSGNDVVSGMSDGVFHRLSRHAPTTVDLHKPRRAGLELTGTFITTTPTSLGRSPLGNLSPQNILDQSHFIAVQVVALSIDDSSVGSANRPHRKPHSTHSTSSRCSTSTR